MLEFLEKWANKTVESCENPEKLEKPPKIAKKDWFLIVGTKRK